MCKKSLYVPITLAEEANTFAIRMNKIAVIASMCLNSMNMITRFNRILTAIAEKCIKENCLALFSALNFAIGKAVIASILTTSAKVIINSGCSAYPIQFAIDWLPSKIKTKNKELQPATVKKLFLKISSLLSLLLINRKKAVSMPNGKRIIKNATQAYSSDSTPYSDGANAFSPV